jgi:LytS/YehU family sensor histidine kinase
VAPLLYLSLVENAFKHGVEKGDKNSWVKVEIDFNEHICTYKVDNSKTDDPDKESKRTGIGLKNTLRRLNLSYQNRHELIVDENVESYRIKLIIELDENL